MTILAISENQWVKTSIFDKNNFLHFCGPRGGGGGVSESMDRRGCAILALKVVPKNLIFG